MAYILKRAYPWWWSTSILSVKLIGSNMFELESRKQHQDSRQTDRHTNLIGSLVPTTWQNNCVVLWHTIYTHCCKVIQHFTLSHKNTQIWWYHFEHFSIHLVVYWYKGYMSNLPSCKGCAVVLEGCDLTGLSLWSLKLWLDETTCRIRCLLTTGCSSTISLSSTTVSPESCDQLSSESHRSLLSKGVSLHLVVWAFAGDFFA